jgi:NADPH-dependent 2,4-dienoyl-CoA reductase/sulfur reductase-like enzyme
MQGWKGGLYPRILFRGLSDTNIISESWRSSVRRHIAAEIRCARIAKMLKTLVVVGGGLAGTEAAWQAAELGVHVKLYEMRPARNTPAHVSDQLAELVCSNSLGSTISAKAPGLLKAEMRGLGSDMHCRFWAADI